MVRRFTAISAVLVLMLFACFPVTAKWETWENCTLQEDEYHDGDSFYIKRGPRSYYIIRLYFVDCPETDHRHPERNEEQARYFQCDVKYIEPYGRKAKKFTMNALRDHFTVYTEKEKAGGTSQKPRYFGFIEYGNGQWLGEELVKAGLGRSYGAPADRPDGVSASRLRMRLDGLERKAKQQRIGIWGAGRDDNPLASELQRREQLQRILDSVQVLSREIPIFSAYNPDQHVGRLPRGTRVYVRHVEGNNYVRIRFKKSNGRLTEALCRLRDLVE